MTQEKNIKVVSEVYCFIHVYKNACIVLIMLRCWTNPRTINYTIPLFYNTKIRPKLKQRIFSWIVWMSDSNYNKALREVLENTNGYWPPSSFSMHPQSYFCWKAILVYLFMFYIYRHKIEFKWMTRKLKTFVIPSLYPLSSMYPLKKESIPVFHIQNYFFLLSVPRLYNFLALCTLIMYIYGKKVFLPDDIMSKKFIEYGRFLCRWYSLFQR